MKVFVQSLVSVGLLSCMLVGMAEGRVQGMTRGRALQEGTSLNITVFGDVMTIPWELKSYESSSQNPNGASVEFLSDGVSAHLKSNMWRQFTLPSEIEVAEDTVLAFDFSLLEEAELQAICLDNNWDLHDGESKCVTVAGVDGFDGNFINLPEVATLAEPNKHFEVPIGLLYTGAMTKLAFINDNDANRTLGECTFSNIEVKQVPFDQRPSLTVQLFGQPTSIANYQQRYDGNQDHLGHFATIDASTPNAITLDGNAWRAFMMPHTFNITETTVLEFDFDLAEMAEMHGICLDSDRDDSSDSRCFVLANTDNFSNMHHVLEKTQPGETNHYKLPVGHFFHDTVSYIAFVQDSDAADKKTGQSTFSNIQIYDENRNDLNIQVQHQQVALPNSQLQYHTGLDSRETVLEVSPDGTTVTLEGNTARAKTIDTPITVTPASQIEFDAFIEDDEFNYLTFGLDDDLTFDNKRTNLLLYGSKGTTLTGQPKITPGVPTHYSIPFGLEDTTNGDMNYLAFVQRNSLSNKSTGKSIIANISIYERPGLKFQMGDQLVPIMNEQLRYDSSTQSKKYDLVDVSQDGLSASVYGNNWKAFPVPSYDITEDTILTFDFELFEETEIHAICIDEDIDHGSSNYKRCFILSGTQENVNNMFYYPYRTDPPYATNSNKKTYAIRVGHYFAGININYLAIIQDNDTTDKTIGKSTFSNIQLVEATTCLLNTDTDITLDVTECTFDQIFAEIEKKLGESATCNNNAWQELMAYFDANHEADVINEIAHICTTPYEAKSISFDQLTNDGYQFVEAFFDGDTTWNYETDYQKLKKDAGAVKVVNNVLTPNKGIEWPDMHNFRGCELRAAMCCWVADRQSGVDADPVDNSDVCYIDFSKTQRSSHVKDGYSIYGSGAEGSVNCHGFAWGNDAGYPESALKGNALFHVAMYDGMYDKGYAEEVPGAPMCGCVEKMPVVTTADCTEMDITKSLSVTYNAAISQFVVSLDITDISYKSCGKDLKDHYQDLVTAGKATADDKLKLDEHLVGADNCDTAIGGFLASKGLGYTGTTTVQ